MKKIIILAAISLTACTTPVTDLSNPKSGQIQRCGGQMSSSVLDYWINKSNASDCVEHYKQNGFK